MDTVVLPWTAEIVLISWRTVKNNKRPPLPSELLATFIVFGTFAVVGRAEQRVSSVLSWGVVIATALNLFGTGDKLVSGSLKPLAPATATKGK